MQMRLHPTFRLSPLLGLLALACPALAAERSPLAPVAARLRAGQEVVLSWNGLPADVEELEVLLSVDGGDSYPLRASPELDGREHHFLWRVPNLATAEARLRIRARLDGREVLFPAGPAFEIVGPGSGVEPRPTLREVTCWIGPEDAPSQAPLGEMNASSPRLSSGGPGAPGTLPPRPVDAPPAREARGVSLGVALSPPKTPSASRPYLPSSTPQRK